MFYHKVTVVQRDSANQRVNKVLSMLSKITRSFTLVKINCDKSYHVPSSVLYTELLITNTYTRIGPPSDSKDCFYGSKVDDKREENITKVNEELISNTSCRVLL